jgi:transcriptional regulator with XRE-family HTH domain
MFGARGSSGAAQCDTPSVAYVPTIKRRRLGAALRRVREATGHSTESAASALGWSQSKVSRVETATTAVTPDDVRTLLELYGAESDEVTTLVNLAMEDRQPAWWRQYSDVLPESFTGYLSLESEASRMLTYESEVVPGLLQTDAYARAILGQHPLTVMPYEIEQAARLRVARQSRLRGNDPLELDVVINEAVVRRVVGGAEVMRAQLAQIIEVAELPNVTLRILPFGAGAHPAANGSFVLLDFPDDDDPRIICLDTLVTTLYREGLREVGAYQLAYERVCALAMGPDDTVALLRSMIEEGAA